jgi:hypothetical protein
MRKLTRKNLDELAKEMSVISEIQQKTFIGGTFYFDYSGNYLGKIGDSNEMQIGTSVIDSGSIPFSIASAETVEKVLTTMGNAIGISGDVRIAYGNGNYQGGVDENGQIFVNYQGNIFGENNYFDFLSLLHHEHYHQTTQSGYTFSSGQNEFQALMYEINQPGFQNTSQYYKENTLNDYYSYYDSGYLSGNNYNSGYF